MPRSAHRLRVALAPPVVVLVAAVLAGCGGGDDEAPAAAAKLPVAVPLAPLAEAVQRIGGEAVAVTNLTPVGGQPHELQPAPGALEALRSAKLVVTLGPEFQPAVSKAVLDLPASTARVDLLGANDVLPRPELIAGMRGPVDGGRGGDTDPHVWASPKRFAGLVERLRDALVQADPQRRAAYERGAAAYLAELARLDGDYRSTLDTCESKTLLTTHPAFAYLAEDYGLQQAVTAGISIAARPDPASLAATRRYAAGRDVSTLFFGAPVPSRLSGTVESRTGLKAATLNPLEGLTQDEVDRGDAYDAIMRRNLQALAEGLDCDLVATGAGDPSTPTSPGASTDSSTGASTTP